MNSQPIFVLASASPTRKNILENAGIKPIVRVSYFDEDAIQVSDPTSLVLTLAQCKAKAIAHEFTGQNALIMGCDSIMYLNGMIMANLITRKSRSLHGKKCGGTIVNSIQDIV